MKLIQKRFVLFLLGCVGTRGMLAYVAKTYPTYLPWMGRLAFFPAIAWLYIYATNSRPTGAEVFGDSIWWNSLRPVHAMLYLLFAVLALRANRDAWKVLVADVVFGLLAFLAHHHSAGNFAQVLSQGL